jgi:hypothetical protein
MSEPARVNLSRAHEGRTGERLAVECWCHQEIVLVPRDHVRAGITRSCGRDGCKG